MQVLFEQERLTVKAQQYARRRPQPPKPKVKYVAKSKRRTFETPIFVGQNLYIKPTYIVSCPEFSFSNKYKSQAFLENTKNLRNNAHHGLISDKASKAIKNAVNWLVFSAQPKRVYSKKENKEFKFKVAFVTLTLPDTKNPITPADFQKKLLNPFLVYIRKYNNLKNYVWKMEYQQNGKLHCHLTVDIFIHYADIRKAWNRLLEKNGYLTEFEAKFGHKNPNSTDIHAVHKIKNIAAYISKYLSKPMGTDNKFTGRIWGCSYDLSRANKLAVHISSPDCATELFSLMNKNIKYEKIIQCNVKKKKEVLVGEMFMLTKSNWDNHITGEIKKAFTLQTKKIKSPVQYFEVNELFSDSDECKII